MRKKSKKYPFIDEIYKIIEKEMNMIVDSMIFLNIIDMVETIGERIRSIISDYLKKDDEESYDNMDEKKDDIMDAEICSERYVN